MTVRVRKVSTDLTKKAKAALAPWMVIHHPRGKPMYANTFKEARSIIEGDVKRFEKAAKELNASDMLQAVGKLQDAVNKLTEIRSGSQWVEGELPAMGSHVKYRAELRRREAM